MSRMTFGPLAAALALAAGIAVASPLDSLGAAPWLRWSVAALVVAVAIVTTWRRHRAVVLAVALAVGAARGARAPIELPAGVMADDRIVDRVVGVVRGPIVPGPRG